MSRHRAFAPIAQSWTRVREFLRARPRLRTVLQDALIYSIALTILAWLARNISVPTVWRSFASADLPQFLAAALAAFALWFFGETLLFAKLFSYFHQRTTFREALPIIATMYFLQVVNLLLAQAAVVVFLHNRKQASWGAATMTLAFQGFVDFFALTSLAVASGVLAPSSIMHRYLPYTTALLVAGLGAALWVRWRAHPSRLEGLLLRRPSLATFRAARFHHYAILYAIRQAIILPYAILYYAESRAFHLLIPLMQVVALIPAVVASTSIPISPNGLGFVQAIVTRSFAGYTSRAQVLAFSLSAGTIFLLCCAMLGLSSARRFAHRIILEGRS